MSIDRRFAIIIGINDYDNKPLNFCVKDAIAVSDVLEKKCFFKKEDIFLITSDVEKKTKEITGHLDKSLEKIQNEIRSDSDSIFFYFAGHGMYEEEKSKLQFHDISIEIKTIFDKINNLRPQNQFYVIDACESGGKVITRGVQKDNLIDKFISNSSGIYFMFASTEKQSAYERKDIGHGVFTNYFLQAIENEKNYDEGILTPNRIQDFVAKETQKDSNFDQTPVIEGRTRGYYPFAYCQDKLEEISRKIENPQIENNIDKEQEEECFPEVPVEKRKKIFEILSPWLNEEVNSAIYNKVYSKEIGDNLSIFNSEISESLTEKIVSESLVKGVISVENIFTAEKIKINENPRLKTFSMIDSFFNNNESKFRTDYYINFYDDSKILSKSIFLKSNNKSYVSAGANFTIYQSLYGIGLAISKFFLDFDGYSNSKIKGLSTEITAYIINKNLVSNINSDIKEGLEDFNNKLIDWNKKRVTEIENFRKIAKN